MVAAASVRTRILNRFRAFILGWGGRGRRRLGVDDVVAFKRVLEVDGLALIGGWFLSFTVYRVLQVWLDLPWSILLEYRLDIAAAQAERGKPPLEVGVVAPWLVLHFE